MSNEKNNGCAEHIFCAPVFITLQHDHCGIGRFAVAGLVYRNDAVFEFFAHNRKTPEGAGINNSD
ncbi:MAG: hypothetical protein V3U84_06400 [Thiotrichaceae bacterium]